VHVDRTLKGHVVGEALPVLIVGRPFSRAALVLLGSLSWLSMHARGPSGSEMELGSLSHSHPDPSTSRPILSNLQVDLRHPHFAVSEHPWWENREGLS
jgi:hypothetical protein